MVEIDRSVGNFGQCILWINDIRNFINYLCYTLSACKTLSNGYKNHAQHHQGHQDCHYVCEQGRQLACSEVAGNNELCTKP